MSRWQLAFLVSFPVFLALTACTSATTTAVPPGAATPRVVTAATATPPPPRSVPPATKAPTVAATVAPARESQAPYYQGKTIEITVESAAGGGTDTVARVSASFLPKFIPGNPRIIVRNQPGAAGAVANNIFYEKTRPDGFGLLQNSSSPIAMQMKNRDISKYDLTRYRYVGNISRAANVLLIRKGLTKRLTDAKSPPVVVGTKEGEETWQALLIWGKEFLGWNLRWVPGYGGTSEMELALRRGEIDLIGSANITIINRLTQEGLTENLAVEDSVVGGKLVRRHDLPDVPTSSEVFGDKKPTGVPGQAYVAWIGPKLIDKSLAAPPGTPDNVMGILTRAYDEMTRSREFKQLMGKVDTDIFVVGIGDQTASIMKEVLGTPPEVLTYTKELQRKVGIIK
ncbi:MAG: hypothetical protein HY673_15840 [Chloroflexi bacterium]|nr:hypothetical protein [Chloroflexota bacterium]